MSLILYPTCLGVIERLLQNDVQPADALNMGSAMVALNRYNSGISSRLTQKGRNPQVKLEYYPQNICGAGECAPCDTPSEDGVTVQPPLQIVVDIEKRICNKEILVNKDTYNNWCSSASNGDKTRVNDEVVRRLTELFRLSILGAHRSLNAYAAAKLKSFQGSHPDGSFTKILQPFSTVTGAPVPNWEQPILKTYRDAELSLSDLNYLSGTDLTSYFKNVAGGGINAAGINVGTPPQIGKWYYEPIYSDTGDMLTIDPRGILMLTYSKLLGDWAIQTESINAANLVAQLSETSDILNTPNLGQMYYSFLLPDPFLAEMGINFLWDAHIKVNKTCDDWSMLLHVETNVTLTKLPFINCADLPPVLGWSICQMPVIECNTTPTPVTPPTPLCIVPDESFTCAEQIVPAGTFVTITPTTGTPLTKQTTVATPLTNNQDLYMLLSILDIGISYNPVTNEIMFLPTPQMQAELGDTITVTFGGACPISFAATLEACAQGLRNRSVSRSLSVTPEAVADTEEAVLPSGKAGKKKP